jgi:site-specific DNA-methyltransferase (adenine-specific)/adenine-specific DNA-methyltransferase
MAKPDSERYELSDAEKRDLIKLIEQGKPLPEKYRFLLFADKREVELVWNGKTREVCTAILPFQTLEHIDEPRKEIRDEGGTRPRHRRAAGQGLDEQAHLGRQQADSFLAQGRRAPPPD